MRVRRLSDCTIYLQRKRRQRQHGFRDRQCRDNLHPARLRLHCSADQEFKAWEIGGTEYKVGDSYTVLVDTEIKALWENSVITPTTYTVTVSNDGNGTASASHAKAAAGTEITLTATPQIGYHFKEWKVTKGDVTITDNAFTMPDGSVSIQAVFEADAPVKPSNPSTNTKPAADKTAKPASTANTGAPVAAIVLAGAAALLLGAAIMLKRSRRDAGR